MYKAEPLGALLDWKSAESMLIFRFDSVEIAAPWKAAMLFYKLEKSKFYFTKKLELLKLRDD